MCGSPDTPSIIGAVGEAHFDLLDAHLGRLDETIAN